MGRCTCCWNLRRVFVDCCWRLCQDGEGCAKLQTAAEYRCLWLDPYVSRRTIECLLAVEVVVTLLLCWPFYNFEALGDLGLPGGRELILFLLVLRIVSDLAGGLGVLRREVTTVKRLYCMQATNLLFSFVVLQPLLLCQCACFEPAMGRVASQQSVDRLRQQCEVWHNFLEGRDAVMGRRLGDGESKAPGNAWPAWPVCHSASDWGMPVPDLFKVLDQGVKLVSEHSSCFELPVQMELAQSLQSVDCRILDHWDWASLPFQELELHLQECFSARGCGGLRLELLAPIPGPPQEGSCGNMTVCKLQHPVMPHPHSFSGECHPANRCPIHLLVNLHKDMEKYECFRFGEENGPVEERCLLVVRRSLAALLLLNCTALLSAAVIRKFLQLNCGDFVAEDVQFEVDTVSEASRSFAGDSFVAGAYSTGSPSSRRGRSFRGRTSVTSVELGQREVPPQWNGDGAGGI
ncbi:unnamed protein product [Effrenium voratum]|nr:unnamed protein product [Effrenium voratum]